MTGVNLNPADTAVSNVVRAVDRPVTIDHSQPAFAGFVNINAMVANGSALLSNENVLRLNNDYGQAGSAFTTRQAGVRGFTTTFHWRLHEGTQPNPADGFTFTLQAVSPTAVGAGGGELGYQGIGSSVAIKFDVYQNAGNPSDNSTGIFFNGQDPIGGTAINPAVVNLRDQHRKRADISYNGSTLTLTITDEQHDPGPNSVTFSFAVDIAGRIGSETAYAGFTGGTGGLYSLQDILDWKCTEQETGLRPRSPTNLRIAETAPGTVTGQGFKDQPVATFTDPGGSEDVGDYTAVIDWGDGSKPEPGTIVYDPDSDSFTVTGSHTYDQSGTYKITVTLSHDTAPDVTVTSSAEVDDPGNGTAPGLARGRWNERTNKIAVTGAEPPARPASVRPQAADTAGSSGERAPAARPQPKAAPAAWFRWSAGPLTDAALDAFFEGKDGITRG